MKMNGPVHCESFFQDQIQQGHQELWCVSLAPNGEILSLFDMELAHSSPSSHFLKVASFIRNEHPKQVVLVKTNPESLIFNDEDWSLIEKIKQLCHTHPTELCDYIKIGAQGFCNLLEFEL